LCRQNEKQTIQLKLVFGGLRDQQVTHVHRVERAAK
jgi:hypothetical protein